MQITVREAIAQFGEVLAGRGLAESYRVRQIGRLAGKGGFAEMCETMDKVDHEVIARYFASLTGSAGDRNNKLDALRQFLTWAERRGYLTAAAVDLLDGYRKRKVTRTPKLYVEADRFAELLDLAGEQHPRDRALAAVILYTLIRQSEIAPLRLADLDLGTLTLQVYRQKTRRYTETGVTPELGGEMRSWLDWYARDTGYISAAAMIADRPDWHLVPARRQGRAWRRLNPERPMTDMERFIKPVVVSMGYPDKQEGCHTIRRGGARAMYLHLRRDMGFDSAVLWVQNMLDHETAKKTLDYIGVDRERDELNDYLRSNSMYGTEAKAIPLRAV